MQSQQFRDLARQLKDNLSRLQEKRSNWESHWQEVSDYMLPRKAEITKERARGDKRHTQIYDATAIHALELLAASLHGMLTSSANKWFSLRFKETELNNIDEAKEWLENATTRMYDAIAKSNFQQEIFECYFDLIAFGTACLMIEEDQEDTLLFSARHIKELYIQENKKGFVDTVYRKFKMPAQAVVDKFGIENVSKDVINIFKKTPFDDIVLVHVARPRLDFDPKKQDKQNMPVQSIYMEFETGHIISIGGFQEMPYVVPRYLKASTEQYGRSPGMNALPDVKVLNKMVENSLKAAAKQIDPPLLVPDDGMLAPIRMSPGSINFFRSGSRERIEPLQINANTNVSLNNENQRREAIAKMFHVDQLLITESRNMTATEVLQRNEEKMRILGPVLGRLQSELLSPLIIRVFNMMLRQGLFMPSPDILSQQELNIEYVSPMALAQRSQELQSLMRGLEIFGSMSQTLPVMDYIDDNGMVKQIIEILGIPATVIKSDQEVEQVRAERAQAEQAAMEQQQLLAETQAAKQAAPLAKVIQDGSQ
tara:strand:+ start:768 stop:2384 length:1617 start_codon:yes stop_codon:yes gene_type:complete